MNNKIIKKLKQDTNKSSYIIYREKYIKDIKIDLIYNETLTDQNKMSDFNHYFYNFYQKEIISNLVNFSLLLQINLLLS